MPNVVLTTPVDPHVGRFERLIAGRVIEYDLVSAPLGHHHQRENVSPDAGRRHA